MEKKSKTFIVKYGFAQDNPFFNIYAGNCTITLSNIEVDFNNWEKLVEKLRFCLKENIGQNAEILSFEEKENNWLEDNFKNQELKDLTIKFFFSPEFFSKQTQNDFSIRAVISFDYAKDLLKIIDQKLGQKS